MTSKVVLYSKNGCHLCERAHSVLQELDSCQNIVLEIVDISKDPDHFEKYFLSIPVVEIDGEVVFQASDIRSPSDIETKLRSIIEELH
jgi:glutaredoxin